MKIDPSQESEVLHRPLMENFVKKCKKFLSDISFPNKPLFLHAIGTNRLKTPLEKEKSLITNNFSFSDSVFYLSEELLPYSSDLKLWSANS